MSIQKLRYSIRNIPFDLFIKLSEDKFTHVFSKVTGLDYRRLIQYMQKGVTQLYVKESDRNLFEKFTTYSAEDVFRNRSLPLERRLAGLLNMTEQNLAEILSRARVENETAVRTRRLVRHYIQMMDEDKESLSLLLRICAKGEYLYYHSMAVSIMSLLIAQLSGQKNLKTLELIGLGGLLHDIGFSQLAAEDGGDLDEFSPNLSTQERRWVLTHPEIGVAMLENATTLPGEVKTTLFQHHERSNGRGYPLGLRGHLIYFPAKVVAVSDALNSLISRGIDRDPLSIEKAVAVMKSEDGGFDRELLRVLELGFVRKRAA